MGRRGTTGGPRETRARRPGCRRCSRTPRLRYGARIDSTFPLPFALWRPSLAITDIEQREVCSDGVRDLPVRRRREQDLASGGALAFHELEHVTAIRERSRVERGVVTDVFLESCATEQDDERKRGNQPRLFADDARRARDGACRHR